MQLPTPPSSPRLSPSCAPEDRLGHLLAGRYQLNTVLGVGAYGVVYTAVDVQTGVTYAVKALNKIGLDARQRQFQQREIELHQRASQHPNICAVIEILDSEDVTFVVLEYCGEGDLFANITERGNYVGNDFMARRIFSQILDAVEYCHSLGIYHRDLKPENILVCDNGMNVKLADFGLATTDFYSTDFGCGSTFYMSPECQQPVPKPFSCYASAPNDVWSLGVVLVNLTCGRNPWKRASLDDSTFRAFLRDPQFLRTILPISAELDCILRRIFEFDAARRITIPELRQLIARCQSFSIKPVTSHAVEQQTTLYTPQSTAETTPRTSMDQYIQAKPQHAEYNNGNSPQHSHRHRYAHRRGNAVKQQQHYVSPQTSGWYMNFLPALDLAQKHMSIEPLLGGVRVF